MKRHLFVKTRQIIAFLLGAILITGCIAMLVIVFRLGPNTFKAFPTYTPQEEAWYSCTQYIDQQVGLYARNAPPYSPDSVTNIAESQYRVDIFYATQGQVYRCELLRHSNGGMELLKLEKINSYP